MKKQKQKNGTKTLRSDIVHKISNYPPPQLADNQLITEKNDFVENKWKILFFVLCGLLFSTMLFIAPQVGDSDDGIDGLNGKYALKYYTERDTTFADYTAAGIKASENSSIIMMKHLKYYGVGFEILPAIAIKYLGVPEKYEMELRHLLCAFFGFLLMFFCGLIGKEIKNWKVAVISLLLIVFTPVLFGLSLNVGYKDVPLAAGFAVAIYAFIRIYKHLPHFKITDILLATAGMACAVSVRIGGILLPFYFAVGAVLLLIFDRKLRKHLFGNYMLLLKTVGICIGFCVAGVLLGLCLYPNFVYSGPVNHIRDAFGELAQFKTPITMLWEGEIISSLKLPPHYLIKSYFYTIPLFIFAGAVLFLLNIKNIWKNYSLYQLCFLLFTVVFPIVFIIHGKSPVYNGWRHTTFVYCSFIPFCAIGYYETIQLYKNKWWQYFCSAALLLLMLPTIMWQVLNYKYAYSYYNILVEEPYGKMDIDACDTSETVCFEWLVKNHLSDTSKHYTVCAKNLNVIMRQDRKKYPNITVKHIGARGFAAADCDYFIMGDQFLPKKVVKTFYPPKGTIYAEKIDGNPIGVVIKKNPLDAEGITLINNNKFAEGIEKLEQAYQYNPNNFGLWYYMGLGYYYTGKYEKSIEFLNKNINFWPAPDDAQMSYTHIGMSLYYLKRHKEAIPYLEEAVKKFPQLQAMLQDCKK